MKKEKAKQISTKSINSNESFNSDKLDSENEKTTKEKKSGEKGNSNKTSSFLTNAESAQNLNFAENSSKNRKDVDSEFPNDETSENYQSDNSKNDVSYSEATSDNSSNKNEKEKEKITATILVNPKDFNKKMEKKKLDREGEMLEERYNAAKENEPKSRDELDRMNTISGNPFSSDTSFSSGNNYSENKPEKGFRDSKATKLMEKDPNLMADGRYMTPSLKSVWDYTCNSQCNLCNGALCGKDCCLVNKCNNGVCEYEDTILVPGCNDGEGPRIACSRGRSNRRDYKEVGGKVVTSDDIESSAKQKEIGNKLGMMTSQLPDILPKKNQVGPSDPNADQFKDSISPTEQIIGSSVGGSSGGSGFGQSPNNVKVLPMQVPFDVRPIAYTNRQMGFNDGMMSGFYSAQLQMQQALMNQMMYNNMMLQEHMKKVQYQAALELMKEQEEADKKKTLNGANGMHSQFMRMDNETPFQDSKNVRIESTPRELQERVIPMNFEVPNEEKRALKEVVKAEMLSKENLIKDRPMSTSKTY